MRQEILGNADMRSGCRVLPVVLLVLSMIAGPRRATAQGSTPTITFAPSGGTYTTSTVLDTITWCDASDRLQASTRTITLNSVSVTSIFSYSLISKAGCYAAAQSVGTLTLGTGRNDLEASITDFGLNTGYGSAFFTYVPPKASPVVSLAPQDSDFGNPAWCVADCFENVKTYATPAYTSLDVARGVTLMYRSGRAHPLGTVQLDATDPSGTPADSAISLKVHTGSGGAVTFTNGSTELFFDNTLTTGGVTRLAGQFDASSLGTGAYVDTAIVTSYWKDGTQLSTATPVRVLINNAQSSAFGAGWTVAGLQQLFVGNGGVLATDGSGAMSFYRGTCAPGGSCTFTSPTPEFATLAQAGTTYTRRYRDGTVATFDSTGRLTRVADRFNNTTSYYYNAHGLVDTIVDPVGQAVTLTYTGSAPYTLTAIATPGSRTASFSVDAHGNLYTITDPDGIMDATFTYDLTTGGLHRLTEVKDRRGGLWDYTYAADGTLDSARAPTVTASGVSTRPTTRESGPSTRLFAAIAGGEGSAGNPVARSIDLRADVVTPRGDSTTYALNRWQAPDTVVDALGRQATFAYDSTTGQLTRSVSVSYHGVDYTWSGPRLTQISDEVTSQVISIAYDTTYDQPTHVSGNTAEEWFTYDTTTTGRPLKTSYYGIGGTTTYFFDSRGRLTKVVDGDDRVSQIFYASTGLENTDSTSAGTIPATRFTRDAFGRVVARVRSDGAIDSTYYDQLNRDTATVDPLGHRTHFAFDSLYLRTVTDAKGQIYQFAPNALGWDTLTTDPTGARDTVRYDADGNVIAQVNRRHQTVTFTYDALNRLTARSVPAGTSGGLTVAYGPTDNYTAYATAASVDSVFLDDALRPSSVHTWRGTSWYTTTPSYNLNQTVAQLGVTSNHWVGTRGPQTWYNARLQADSLQTVAGTSTFSYDAAGLTTGIGYPTGYSTTTTAYTAHLQPMNAQYTLGVVDHALGLTYAYDSLGRITRFQRTVPDSVRGYWYHLDGSLAAQVTYGSASPCDTTNTNYGYNCLPPSVVGTPYTFGWDAVGNPTGMGDTVDTGNRLVAAAGYHMAYDADGDLIRKYWSADSAVFNQHLFWNALSQLDSAITTDSSGTSTVTFGYDGFGRRVRKTVFGSDTTGYLYLGADLFMRLNASGSWTTEYSYLPGVDQPQAITTSAGATYYVARDARSGSVRGLVRPSDDSTVALYTYTPFGELVPALSVDTVPNDLKFAARELDGRTNLYYFRSRYYDPQVGRFISEDPTGLAGGINGYAYAGNDPVNGRDPTGLSMYMTCVTYQSKPATYVYVGGQGGLQSPAEYSTVCWETGSGTGGQVIGSSGAWGPTTGGGGASVAPSGPGSFHGTDEAQVPRARRCAAAVVSLLVAASVDALSVAAGAEAGLAAYKVGGMAIEEVLGIGVRAAIWEGFQVTEATGVRAVARSGARWYAVGAATLSGDVVGDESFSPLKFLKQIAPFYGTFQSILDAHDACRSRP